MKKRLAIKKDKQNQFIFGILFTFLIFVAILFSSVSMANANQLSFGEVALSLPEAKDYIYLSDMDYITANNWSYNGWAGHSIQKDKNPDGGIIKLKVNGVVRSFIKGMGLHAKGQLTYDISELSHEYTRFTAMIGLDASKTSASNFWFQILVSDDGTNWTSLYKSKNITPGGEAIPIDLDIEGHHYLRIYTDPNGSNQSDHGVLGNAKLVTKDYEDTSYHDYEKLHPLNYYDEILSNQDISYNQEQNHRLIVEREFVRKMDYEIINAFVNVSLDKKELLDWIVSSDRILEECVEVGEISNSAVFFTVLSHLYENYQDDLQTTNGYVYEKMMIALAAAYSTDRIPSPLLFNHISPNYDYMERFRLMKKLFDDGLMQYTEEFKNYHVELMRTLMQDSARNDEVLWMNYYPRSKNYNNSVYAYVNHTGKSVGYNYAPFYDLNYKEQYDNKYHLTQYGVPFGDNNTQRIWMIIERGGICWNQSRVFQSLFNNIGRPTIGSYQPGHEAAFFYTPLTESTGTWGIANNVFGWGKTCTTWYGGNRYRTLFNWANKSFTNQPVNNKGAGNSGGYLYLAQDNLNHYREYKESFYLNLLANSYSDNQKKVDIYNLALQVNPINLDSYDYKINAYKTLNLSSHDWQELASDIIDAYTFYPMAMNDLLKLIRPYLNGSDLILIDQKEHAALTKASVATKADLDMFNACKEIAKVLLGKTNGKLATFSFDGDDVNQIILNSSYDNYDLAWHYSLDGGVTKSDAITLHRYTLSKEEIKQINEEKDILIYIDGLDVNTPAYTIDISKGSLPSNLYGNDLENRVVGVTSAMEWRYQDTDEWTSYEEASPVLTGDASVEVRVGFTQNFLPSDAQTYSFTEDNQPDTRKYIPVSHLSVHAVSSQATNNNGSATYALDGNYHTRWHSAWNGSDKERYFTIKLDKPVFLSAVEFVPSGGGNGKIYDGTIYGSMDGENWEVLTTKKNLTYTNQANTIADAITNTKSFDLDESKQVQYVKIVADRTNGNWFTARAFNLYQDLTKRPHPTAGIEFSTTNPTTGDVVARLVNPSTDIEITNNGGSDTYTFKDNGEFTFTFVEKLPDGYGKTGTVTARVDWIDRVAPTGTISYSTTNKTNQSVIATLNPSEDVIVTNNGEYMTDTEGHVLDQDGNVIPGYIVLSDGTVTDSDGNVVGNMNTFTYEFIDNGEFTFEFRDRAGNTGSATAKVDWIDMEAPVGTLYYDKTGLTNEDVIVSIQFNEDAIVTNNQGSRTFTFKENGEFTFEFKDTAGNINQLTAKVHWIDKEAPTAELKYDKQSDKVIVSVVNPSEEITFQEGIGVYEFTQNGSYDIIFYDLAGNTGKLTAVIDSLKDNHSDNNNNENRPDDNHTSDNENQNSNSSNTSKPNVSKPDNSTKPITTNYEKYSFKDIMVEIPKSAFKGEGKLTVDTFHLDDKLASKFGNASEYYDFYFLNKNSKKVNIESTKPLKITIPLSLMKEFIGVYEIDDKNNIQSIDYVKNGNHIEITTKTLGKYVVSYQELEPVSPNVTIPVIVGTEKRVSHPFIAVTSILVVVLISGVYLCKKRKNN